MKSSPNKYQYQEDLIKGIKKGELHVYGMGRGTGKSKAAQIAYNKWKLDRLTGKKEKWGEWKKSFVLLPKKCKLTGKWVIGTVCVRTKIRYIPWTDSHAKVTLKQYASAKEIFRRLLDGTL